MRRVLDLAQTAARAGEVRREQHKHGAEPFSACRDEVTTRLGKRMDGERERLWERCRDLVELAREEGGQRAHILPDAAGRAAFGSALERLK
jgi:hypothetical protein